MNRTTPLRSARALAEFRYLLRDFLVQGDIDARDAGLEPQQYLLLLHLFALPTSQVSDTKYVAERLKIKHHSAVELIDRAWKSGLVKRVGSEHDHRKKLLRLTPRGRSVISVVTRMRLQELHQSGPLLIQALEGVLAALNMEAGKK